jgi:hypothetical protein
MTLTSGMKSACTLTMRAFVALLLLGGCFGAGSQGASRPAVMPLLSELPADATKRDAVLDSANTVAGPEHRKGMTSKERKVETAAATAAAILGEMFSSTQSVTLGTATLFDENQLSVPQAAPPPPSTSAADVAKPDARPANDAGTSNTDLIPWIKLK